MRNIITLLAASLLAAFALTIPAQSAAESPHYSNMPVMYDLSGNLKPNWAMAKAIEDSIKVKHHEDGSGIIQGSPCTTPKDLLDEIQKYYPGAGVESVAQLPKFYRSLIMRKAAAEGLLGKKYNMMRMECRSPDHRVKGDMQNPIPYARELRADEYVFYIPNYNGGPFTAADCFNIIEPTPEVHLPPPPVAFIPPAEDGCLHHMIQVPYGDTLHQALYARRLPQPSACKGMKLEHGHGTIYHCDVCTFDSSVNDLKAEGYLGIIQPGNTIRFTCENKDGCVLDEEEPISTGDRIDDDIFLFCLTYPNGGRSLVEDVHWKAYRNGVVYIGYSAPAEWLAAGGVLHHWKDSLEQRTGITTEPQE